MDEGSTTMDPLQKDLQDKLSQDSLTLPEVQDGITTCFVLTNRQFLRNRMGDARPNAAIDAVTRDIVDEVYAEIGLTPDHLFIGGLHQAWHTLDKQLGFEADPDLLAHHGEVIEGLLDRAEKQET
jgi:hypothetical protein